MKHKRLQAQAMSLIEKYFDGSTSLEEERTLRKLLTDPRLNGVEIDNVRAVMGFLAAGTPRRQTHIMRRISPIIAVAASVAVIITIAIHLHIGNNSSPTIMAYVGGRQINNTEQVMNMVENELDIFRQASIDINLQIDDELSQFDTMLNTTDAL